MVDRSALVFGSLTMWIPALAVIIDTLIVKFFTRGVLSVAAVLIGIIAGYLVVAFMGQVKLNGVGRAGWFMLPIPLKWGFHIDMVIIIDICRMALILAIETMGDVWILPRGVPITKPLMKKLRVPPLPIVSEPLSLEYLAHYKTTA